MWPPGLSGLPAPPSSEPLVEREELRRLAREPRRHRHQVRVDREVDDRAPRERDVRRVAVAPVLRDRVLDVLAGERVLELGRRDRDPVEEEREVDVFVRRARRGAAARATSRFAS